MKRIFLLLLALSSFAQSKAQWVACNSGTTAKLNGICFADSLNGICTTEKENVLRTTDGGTTWSKVLHFPGAVIYKALVCSNTLHVYAGANGSFWDAFSTNKGATWNTDTITGAYSELPVCHNGNLYSKNYISNSDQEIIKLGTPNVVIGHNLFPYAVDDSHVYGYVTPAMVFFKKDFSGAIIDSTTRLSGRFSSNSLSNSIMRVFGDTVITCATYPNVTEVSFDGGTNWINYLTSTTPSFAISIVSGKTIVGTTGGIRQIVRSDNSGASFTPQGTVPHKVNNFFFLNEQAGWLCGDSGMIYRATVAYPAGVGTAPAPKQSLKLYPNPALTNLTVEGVAAGSTLQLSDLAGRAIPVSVNFQQGQATIEVAALPAGTYLVEVISKEGRRTTGRWVKP